MEELVTLSFPFILLETTSEACKMKWKSSLLTAHLCFRRHIENFTLPLRDSYAMMFLVALPLKICFPKHFSKLDLVVNGGSAGAR